MGREVVFSMLGMILWREGQTERGEKSVEIRERRVLNCRFLCAEIRKTEKQTALRRRLRKAGKLLHRAGVREAVFLEGIAQELMEDQGLVPISTLPLRRMLAADWVSALLTEQGILPSGARVAVAADRLTGEITRTVTELALRHRYVLLELEQGGETLCRHLRREYGVAVQRSPTSEQLAEADALVLFAPCSKWRGGRSGVTLRLYSEEESLPSLALPPEKEEQLPIGLVRGQLLAALYGAGALRPGDFTLVKGHRAGAGFPLDSGDRP